MTRITDEDIAEYIQANIDAFHTKRLESLLQQSIQKLLRRKNPYLFMSKHLVTASDLVRSLLDAYLSSQEETLFGSLLEGLAIHIAEKVHGGQKSATEGIDLEFDKDGVRYLVSIKSGPNWGNSSQVKKMKDHFKTASQRIRQGNSNVNIVFVNGCCYGRDKKPDKGDYFKYCGQGFWELVSGESDFYTRIIEPLGHDAKQRNEKFAEEYDKVTECLSTEFSQKFCAEDGLIDWNKIVAFSSSNSTS